MRAVLRCSIAVGWTMAMGAAESPPPPFVEFIYKVAAAEKQKDTDGAVRALEDIQRLSADGWGFSGGAGPNDRAFVAQNALTSYATFLPWKGALPSEIGAGRDFPILQWLRSDGRSHEAMSAMLLSTDPLARWIALEKIEHTGSVSSALVPTLQTMAKEDDRLRVIRRGRSEPPSDGKPAPPSEVVFDAPLRRMANDLLGLAGETRSEIDQRSLSIEGLRWLSRLYLNKLDDRDARVGILSALLHLEPLTPEIVQAQQNTMSTWPQEKWEERFRVIARNTATPLSGVGAGSNESGGARSANTPGGMLSKPVAVVSKVDPARPVGRFGWIGAGVAAVILLVVVMVRRKERKSP